MSKIVLKGAIIVWAIFLSTVFVFATAPKLDNASNDEEATQVVTEYIYKEIPCQQNHATAYYGELADSLTKEDIDLIAKITYLEAGNQSLTGQRAVVEVILNRVLSPKFPNTVEEVIYQDNPVQFSTAKRASQATPSDTQYLAIEMTLKEVNPILEQDVLFFSTHENWREVYEQIGDHYFCY